MDKFCIRLMKSTNIVEGENFCFFEKLNDHQVTDRSVELYLSHLSAPADSFIRFKPTQIAHINKLDLKIKVELAQEYTFNVIAASKLFDYAKISRLTPVLDPVTGETHYSESSSIKSYYFVRKINWLSEAACELELHMDVLNSIVPNLHYKFSPLTHITRQHKDRFKYVSIPYGYTGYEAHIDEYSEGLNPTLYKDSGSKYVISQALGDYEFTSSFYLIYKNSNMNPEDTGNVVNCFLAFEGEIKIPAQNMPQTLQPSDLEWNIHYYFFGDISANGDSVLFRSDSSNIYTLTSGSKVMVEVMRQTNGMSCIVYTYADDPTSPYNNVQYAQKTGMSNINNIVLPNSSSKFRRLNEGADYFEYTLGKRTYIVNNSHLIYVGESYPTKLKPYEDIDKTDSRIIKIIKIPYLPDGSFDLNSNDELTYNDEKWMINVDERLLQLSSNNFELYQPIHSFGSTCFLKDEDTIGYMLNPLSHNKYDNTQFPKTLSDLRNTAPDPKLYHSDFYYWKYIYDSFSKVFANEKYRNGYEIPEYNWIAFFMTNTINSRFMFRFTTMTHGILLDEDYQDYLVIQRNNECVLYNNAYINYIRSGFNYDVKNKNRQEAFSWFTTGAGLVAGVASVIGGSKTLGAGLIATSVLSIASSINNTIQLENNMEQKLNQLKYQSTSVYGADDVDLMTYYNAGNKLWRVKYEVSPRMRKSLQDLFYYAGYIDDVTEVPTINSRMWFNFLQCEPHFEFVKGVEHDVLEELINKYKGGVTFLHMNRIDGVATWDIKRERENWERVFFTE